MKRIFKLDPEKNLTNQWPFWIINGVLFAFAIILTCIIYLKGDYYVDWSPSGFRTFLSDFGFPISMSALIIPASALIATMHRSSQLSTQINLLTGQNKFANYYKHQEEFDKYLNRSNKVEYKRLFSGCEINIHRKVFPKVKMGDYSFDNNLLEWMNQQADLILTKFSSIIKKGDIGDFISELKSSNDFIGNKFGISIPIADKEQLLMSNYPNPQTSKYYLEIINNCLLEQQDIFKVLKSFFEFECDVNSCASRTDYLINQKKFINIESNVYFSDIT